MEISNPRTRVAKTTRVAAVYGLVDPRKPRTVRYVGSSHDVEGRLYAHIHSTAHHDQTPKTQWVRQLRKEGVTPFAKILQPLPEGVTPAQRQAMEQKLVATLRCDLNVRLAPLGHPNSRNSLGKRLRLEVEALRAEVARLRAIVDLG